MIFHGTFQENIWLHLQPTFYVQHVLVLCVQFVTSSLFSLVANIELYKEATASQFVMFTGNFPGVLAIVWQE